MAGETGQLRDFIEDLGPGQVVGRQALGARCLGEIQLSLNQKKGNLEIEVIRAKDLKAKQGSKVIPGRRLPRLILARARCLLYRNTRQDLRLIAHATRRVLNLRLLPQLLT